MRPRHAETFNLRSQASWRSEVPRMSETDDTALQSDRHGMGPIVRGKFAQYAFNMPFDGFLGDRQHQADLPVRIALRD